MPIFNPRIFPLTIFALVLLPGAAGAVQDQPVTLNGVEMVCTGVGSAKDDPRWQDYPVKIVLATANGANLANAHFTLTESGKTVAETDCDAPWLLFKLPAGNYSATATLNGTPARTQKIDFKTDGDGPQQELTIQFPPPDRPRD
jgi:hypothetical protein